MQRSMVIESSTSDDHDEIWDKEQEYLRNIYGNKDPIKGMLGLAYISRAFKNYWIKPSVG
jgi:hypothetical protein